jgi:hypothetical protein
MRRPDAGRRDALAARVREVCEKAPAGAGRYHFRVGGSQTVQRERGQLGKYNPRPDGRRPVNVGRCLRETSRAVSRAARLAVGVRAGVMREAREEAQAGTHHGSLFHCERWLSGKKSNDNGCLSLAGGRHDDSKSRQKHRNLRQIYIASYTK